MLSVMIRKILGRSFLVPVAPVLLLFCILARPAGGLHDHRIVFKAGPLENLSLGELVKDLEGVRAVTVGEQHDNREHHEAQLRIIRALHEAGQDIAIGFEQFGVRSQDTLDRFVSGEAGTEELFRAYSRDWELNWWSLYFPVFKYARDHEIPMVGLNIPREIVRQVASEGFSSLNAQQRGKIRVLSCSIDQRYQEALARVLGHKGKSGGEQMFNRFCEAQVVWDTSMALNAVDYLKSREGKTIVILAGNFHAWKRGIPEQIARVSDLPVKSILPSRDTSFFDYEVFLEDADYVWWFENKM